MSKLIFMPWYSISQKVELGDFVLHPFDCRGTNPHFGAIEADAKLILKNYLLTPFTQTDADKQSNENPIKLATLIEDSLNKADDDLEILQYVVSFCAVSSRNFSGSDYLSTENTKIFVQLYDSPLTSPIDPFVTNPRKDGISATVFSSGYFREIKPPHISEHKVQGIKLQFDDALSKCLWSLFKSVQPNEIQIWKYNVFPALFSFYHANTDGNTKQADCIYSHGAIERLLLGNDYKEQKLVDKLLSLITQNSIIFTKCKGNLRNWSTILYPKQVGKKKVMTPVSSILEGWVREHCRLRNSFAHGNHGTNLNLVWNIDEHLILSSFFLPLLMKLFLSTATSFVMSDDDLRRFKSFERLLSLDPESFMSETSPHSGISNWAKVLDEAFWDVLEEDELPEMHDIEYS